MMIGHPAETIPVERLDLATQDVSLLTAALVTLYADHRPHVRSPRPMRTRAEIHTAAAGGLLAGRADFNHWDYLARFEPHDDLMAMVTLNGHGTLATSRERLDFGSGEVFLDPPDQPHSADLHSTRFALLRIPRSAPAALAEESSGLPRARLRFESMAPVSDTAAALWSRTVAFGCQQLVDSGVTEISPLVIQELIRTAAAVLLATFPNTAMTASYLPVVDWAPSASLRRAAAFMHDYADQPISVDLIAAAGGLTVRVLQYGFHRHFGVSPTGYLRRVRLERAHQELRDADPAAGLLIREVARRWGWATSSQFAAAYQRRYGQLPSQTLRQG